MTNTAHSVGAVSFSVPPSWRKIRVNTPATKLCLAVMNGNGDPIGIVKVDVGVPVEKDLRENVREMESQFSGKSTDIVVGSVVLTSTPSTTVTLPRYIFSTIVDGKLYLIFIASNHASLADRACQSIRSTLKISNKNTNASGVGS